MVGPWPKASLTASAITVCAVLLAFWKWNYVGEDQRLIETLPGVDQSSLLEDSADSSSQQDEVVAARVTIKVLQEIPVNREEPSDRVGSQSQWLEEMFSSQPADASSASRIESRIYELLGQTDMGIGSMNAECRTTICRVQFVVADGTEDDTDGSGFERVLPNLFRPIVREESRFNTSTGSVRKLASNGLRTGVVYIYEQPKGPPPWWSEAQLQAYREQSALQEQLPNSADGENEEFPIRSFEF